MRRFDSVNYMKLTSSNDDLDLFSARFKDIRFQVPTSRIVEVDAAFESNLPLIAHKYLGDQDLWWAILDFNGLVDPIEDISPGVILKIPERRSLMSMLDSNKNTEQSSVVSI